MQLRWKASFSASCLHAATCLSEGLPVTDSIIATVLLPATEALCGELTANGFAIESTLPLLIGLAADYENNRQLMERAVWRSLGPKGVSAAGIVRLTGCLSDLEAAWLREQPNLVEELAVRGRPLREQWEARGPGLLRAMQKLTAENFLVSSAEVVLVSPLVGGHGRAHLLSNRVTFEAMLTHPQPELPEILRLGWLLSQLNLEVSALSEPIPRPRLPWLASLATLPLVLAAAESVELLALDPIAFNQVTLARVMDLWHLPPTLPDTAPQKLLDWWHTYEGSQVRWPVAMSALDQMMQ